MIAMQYRIVLPADYDMAIIRRRIADKGHVMDDFPGLAFKAYLHAARADRELPCRDNLYAPFYLWRESEAMGAFLSGPGFAGLARDFGRPPVGTWLPWQAAVADDLTAARCATQQVAPLSRDVPLAEYCQAEAAATQAAMADGALAAVTAFDPTRWTRVRLRLWPDLRAEHGERDEQLYRVGHVSQPAHPH